MKQFILAAISVACLVAPGRAEEVHLGGIFSLTGPAAFLGTSVRDGLLLGLDEVNEKELAGKGRRISLTVSDDAGDRAQTISIVNRYANDAKVLAVFGPSTGTVATTAAAVANDRKIPLFTPANSDAILEAGPWSFITGQLASFTIPYIVNYAVKNAHVKNCGLISVVDNESYVILSRNIEEMLVKNGQKLAFKEDVKVSDSDFTSLATKVAANKSIDCLFISQPGPQAGNLMIQLRNAGLDPKVRIFGHNAFSTPQLIKVGGAAVEGLTFIGEFLPGGSTEAGKEFVKMFHARYKSEPDNWNAYGYSIAFLVADTLKRLKNEDLTRDGFRQALVQTKNVPVIIGDGKFSINAQRAPEFGMIVMSIRDGRFVLAQ